jgi:hypothetical protein
VELVQQQELLVVAEVLVTLEAYPHQLQRIRHCALYLHLNTTRRHKARREGVVQMLLVIINTISAILCVKILHAIHLSMFHVLVCLMRSTFSEVMAVV